MSITRNARLSASLPKLLSIVPVRVIRLHLFLLPSPPHRDWNPLIVASFRALQLVHVGQGVARNGIELAPDVVTLAGEIDEERDLVGAADEGVLVCGAVDAEGMGVARLDQVLKEWVVGEAFLEGAVGEDEGRTMVVKKMKTLLGAHGYG
eukprot:TRINITY_DN24591_c0_g1_i1.p3 TRINITY_DN24591_c0_g1~~TRINITY_DN24591_c0_g1_i1.p3  ORF type:complete len:150 (-),score=30.02 TRINITY_DN24591_c0_g1_i1:3493-3942(-)